MIRRYETLMLLNPDLSPEEQELIKQKFLTSSTAWPQGAPL
jgi:hypothetical protein